MNIYISIEDDEGIRETTKPIEVDDELLALVEDKVKHILSQIKPYIEAMMMLKNNKPLVPEEPKPTLTEIVDNGKQKMMEAVECVIAKHEYEFDEVNSPTFIYHPTAYTASPIPIPRRYKLS